MFFKYILYISLVYTCVSHINASAVHELTASNFDTLVKKSNNLWIVEFYSPSCPYCKEFAPEYEQVAITLAPTNIKVGRVDGVQNDQLSGAYNIHGYPTVKMFKPGSGVPEDYNGPRKSNSIVDTAKALALDKRIRSFGDVYLDLPQTLRVPQTKKTNDIENAIN